MLSYGEVIRIKYYSISGASGSYDDDVAFTCTGSVMTSGLVQPMSSKMSSYEATLMQQGLIKSNDVRIYVRGSVDTSGTMKIAICGGEYSVTDAGVNTGPLIDGAPVYKKIYARFLHLGSFDGE